MKRALIVGSAPCVFDDLLDAPRWPIIAVNYAGLRNTGPIEMWVSLHFRLLAKLIDQRYDNGADMNFEAYSRIPNNVTGRIVTDCGVEIKPAKVGRVGNGSSGLLAVMTAIDKGYDQLILCGIPLEGSETLQANDEIEKRTRGRRGAEAFERFRHPWKLNEELIRRHVRSMSGWTREVFGGPEEWM